VAVNEFEHFILLMRNLVYVFNIFFFCYDVFNIIYCGDRRKICKLNTTMTETHWIW